MKVIIPCGGFGTRVAPWTKYISKELLPINGMPVICKVINELLECKEIDEIIFVTSSEKELMKKIILQHFPSKHQYFNFVIDDTHKGLDNSILIAKPYCKNTDATIFYWPDCFNWENETKNLIKNFNGNSLIGVVQVDDVTRYGNIMIENNRIKSIIQKPKNNNTGSKFVYWGKAILNRAFWNKFSGNLDSAFIGEQVYELRSTPYDTGNLFDYAKANSDFTYKNRS